MPLAISSPEAIWAEKGSAVLSLRAELQVAVLCVPAVNPSPVNAHTHALGFYLPAGSSTTAAPEGRELSTIHHWRLTYATQAGTLQPLLVTGGVLCFCLVVIPAETTVHIQVPRALAKTVSCMRLN